MQTINYVWLLPKIVIFLLECEGISSVNIPPLFCFSQKEKQWTGRIVSNCTGWQSPIELKLIADETSALRAERSVRHRYVKYIILSLSLPWEVFWTLSKAFISQLPNYRVALQPFFGLHKGKSNCEGNIFLVTCGFFKIYLPIYNLGLILSGTVAHVRLHIYQPGAPVDTLWYFTPFSTQRMLQTASVIC